jgi:hypothetical protein
MSTTRDNERGPYAREQDLYPAEPDLYPADYEPDVYPDPGVYPDDALEIWGDDGEPVDGYQPRRHGQAVDEWMDGKIKFGGTGVKRKTAALIALGAWGFLPLFFMRP